VTGPFGSGCTLAAQTLAQADGYRHVSLSAAIKDRWNALHPGQAPRREDLQALGNTIRRDSENRGALAIAALWGLENDAEVHKRLVFDSIRNPGEVDALRDRFGTVLYLLAIDCTKSDRWERLQHRYAAEGLDGTDFTIQDVRDRGEDDPFGQQVQLCVDAADIFITNSNEVNPVDFAAKLLNYVRLAIGEAPRYATPTEIYMNMAYSASHGSKCLKRQVGAVVVEAPAGKRGEVVGTGFNENPPATSPCVEEPTYGAKDGHSGRCYRDLAREEGIRDRVASGWHCPSPGCGKKLVAQAAGAPLWACPHCGANLFTLFWPDRAMSVCTAVHAETAALMAAGTRARGATLYTSTFPCFQCAEKIIQAGIAHIVFTEPYPDLEAALRLGLGHIEATRFEGIRSRRFEEIFARARPYAERAADRV
jgi:deoxycytidylate deaminase/dephospho-CoA kinase